MILEGKVHLFGNNIDTDVIIPARYLNTADPGELALHCMEDSDPNFAKKVKDGDIIVAGENFGCGSSREHAPLAIKASGVSCVVAKSFARIFYRNAINIGLPIVVSGLSAQAGDCLRVDLGAGTLKNLTTGEELSIAPFPPFLQQVIEQGGLMAAMEAAR